MSNGSGAIDLWAGELRLILAPLMAVGDNPRSLGQLFAARGWTVGDRLTADIGSVFQAVQAAAAAFDAVSEVLGGAGDLEGLLALLRKTAAAMVAVQQLPNDLEQAITITLDQSVRAAFAQDIIELLLLRYLERRTPVFYSALSVAGLIRDEDATAIVTPGGDNLRTAVRRPHLAFSDLPSFIKDPAAHIRAAHAIAAGLPDAAAAEAAAVGLLTRVEDLLGELGARALAGVWQEDAPGADRPEARRSLSFGFSLPDFGSGSDLARTLVGATIELVPADATTFDGRPGPAIQATPFGLVNVELPIGPWALGVSVEGSPERLVIDPSGARAVDAGGAPTEARIDVSFGRVEPFPPLGASGGPRLEINDAAVRGNLVLGAESDYGIALVVADSNLVVEAEGEDGFLGRFLPAEGLTIPFAFTLGWSRANGLRFEGGVSGGVDLELRTTPHKTLLSILRVDEVQIAIRTAQTGLRTEATITAVVTLGPIVGTVERFGVAADVSFPPMGGNVGPANVSLGIAGPSGVGLIIRAGPVTGGGYLIFDPPKGQYTGALQLSIKTLELAAIGILSTRLPDDRPGFSLLIIVAAEFPPIQLGFGFTLSGIGGLLGINRTASVEALRDGVRARALDALLFPRNPVENAPRLVADLQRVFPIAENRFTFGPMVRLGWGPRNLLSIEALLILDLPSPVRLALLGRLRLVLPTEDTAVADLRLDIVGVIDFDRGEASVDASLVDSRLAGFALTGDMAARIGWGATKQFALSTGGFNPRFEPPVGFPALSRMSLALSDSENPRLRLEAYFAVTSNTVQFGARADVFAAAETVLGTFSAAAWLFFDALVQIEPFHFIVDLGGGVEVARDGRPILLAQLAATLAGPAPWYATGYVEVHFLGKHRIGFEVTAGEAVPEAVPTVDLDALLAGEVRRTDVWAAVPPDAAAGLVSLRDAAPGTGILVHPLGGITLHQRLLPFGKRITRFGAAIPVGGPATYQLVSIRVGAETAAPIPLLDDFAPGQYDDLPEDARLSRPAFEGMQAGGSAAVAGLALPAVGADGAVGIIVEPGYDEAIIDDSSIIARQPRRRVAVTLPSDLATALAVAAAAARQQGFVAPQDRTIRMRSERYVVASANTLVATDSAETQNPTSAAEAYDRVAAAGRPAGDFVVAQPYEIR